jgi:nuclear pore complex protein Nup107
MADRVGKEVEKFAERVDHWHTHGNEDENAKYQTTVSMVGKFRDLAKSTVDELQKQNDRENKGLLDKSVRRRIQDLGPDPTAGNEKAAGRFSQSIIPSIEPSVTSPSSSVQELRHWQEELATWELVRLIIDHYHPDPRIDFSQEEAARAAAKDEEISQFATKKEVWDRFLIVDKGAREKKLILKWLQQTAKNTESDIESIIGQCKSNSGKDTNTWTSGWLDTKAKIKQAKRMQGVDKPLDADHLLKTNDGVSSLVTRLDPDAPARQQQHALAESDEYYENALWMVCYEMLRRGEPWERISDWCKERNEAWRGVSLGAAHDSQPKDAPNMAGNDLGYLFRRMCSYASRETRIPYESAVYALLSGDVDGVQAVCRSWDDHVYTYYNALLLSRFDDILKDRVTPSMLRTFPFAGVTKRFGPWKSTNKHVIDLLMADPASSTLAKAPIKVIQGSLISQSLDELMYRVGVAVADMLQTDDRINNLMLDPDSELEAPQPRMAKEKRLVSAEDFHQTLVKDAHALRILVHVYIALGKGLKVVEADTDAKSLAINNVVTFYIEFLRTTKRLQLIPLYAAQLGKSGGAQCMARVLLDIKNNEEQKRCLNLMKQYDIDYLQAVTENVRLQLSATGFVDSKSFETTDPISRLTLLEKGPVHDSYLWPGVRIQHDIPGCDISAKEEAVVESLMWYDHLEKDINATFRDLYAALETFLRKF